MTAGAFVLGIVLATAAAAALAMSMVVQRYALASGESHVPLFGVPCRANVVWFLGLVGYGAANGLYVASLQYGPLALMASVFTLLLVFRGRWRREGGRRGRRRRGGAPGQQKTPWEAAPPHYRGAAPRRPRAPRMLQAPSSTPRLQPKKPNCIMPWS